MSKSRKILNQKSEGKKWDKEEVVLKKAPIEPISCSTKILKMKFMQNSV